MTITSILKTQQSIINGQLEAVGVYIFVRGLWGA